VPALPLDVEIASRDEPLQPHRPAPPQERQLSFLNDCQVDVRPQVRFAGSERPKDNDAVQFLTTVQESHVAGQLALK